MDRGFGRTFYLRRYQTDLKKYNDIGGIGDYLMGKSEEFVAMNQAGKKNMNNQYNNIHLVLKIQKTFNSCFESFFPRLNEL